LFLNDIKIKRIISGFVLWLISILNIPGKNDYLYVKIFFATIGKSDPDRKQKLPAYGISMWPNVPAVVDFILLLNRWKDE